MAYASRSGRASVSVTNPRAFGVCDRCGCWYNRDQLANQFEWRGAALMPTYQYVCPRCYDTPNEQLRAIVIPPDPLPVIQPRVEFFLQDESTFMSLGNGTVDPVTNIPIPSQTTIGLVSGGNMTTEPLGLPKGLNLNAIMPQALVDGVPMEFGEAIPVLSVIGIGTDVVTVTCGGVITGAPWNLSTGSQIAASGLASPNANGFFSVTVTTNTQFTYHTWGTTNGSLLTSDVSILTCQVGIPLGWDTIPTTPPNAWETPFTPINTNTGSPIGLLLALTYAD